MKRWSLVTGILLSLVAVGTALWLWFEKPEILEDSIVTRQGTVTDRAMSEGLPYVTVEFPDGTAVCCWGVLTDVPIPEAVCTGRNVEVTYGTEKDRDRQILLDIRLEGLDYKR